MSEDTSKQFLWSKPDFDTKEEEVNHLYNRYTHWMKEEAVPPEPNRAQELAYLDHLENSFYEDPYITLHPKLYAASPYRMHFRHYREMLSEYRKTFAKNFAACVILSWPVIIYLANRRRYHKHTGVPVTYMRINLFTPDYRLADSAYNATARRRFNYGLLKYAFIFGFVGAYLTTDKDYFKDDLNTRPDFNAMRSLVSLESLPVKERKVFEMMHGNYFGAEFNERNVSIWKRTLNYFYPFNDYVPNKAYCEPFFDYKKDYAPEEFKNHYHFNI